jgi:hypothetical protein
LFLFSLVLSLSVDLSRVGWLKVDGAEPNKGKDCDTLCYVDESVFSGWADGDI